MSKEHLIVLPIEPIPTGAMYPSGEPLPLHCTVMHWFRLSHSRFDLLSAGVARISGEVGFGAIELVSDKAELFGPNNDVPVHVLHPDEHLSLLHKSLYRFLAASNSLPQDLEWIGEGYRPHVTSTAWRHFPPGTRFRPPSIAIIERGESRDKYVVDSHVLGAPPF